MVGIITELFFPGLSQTPDEDLGRIEMGMDLIRVLGGDKEDAQRRKEETGGDEGGVRTRRNFCIIA